MFKDFVDNYLLENCEGETFEVVGLTDFNVGGAGKSGKEVYFSQYTTCMAFIKEGEVEQSKFRMFCYLDEGAPCIKITPLTVYTFTVKKVKEKDLYYLLDLKSADNSKFVAIIEEQTRPITLQVCGSELTFNRRYNEFEGNVTIEGKSISLTLRPEKNTTNAEISLSTFETIKNNFKFFYSEVLQKCAECLVANANEWQEDDDESAEPITVLQFMKRVDKSTSFSLEISKTRYTFYFDDDDMFWGHSIICDGDIETGKFDATIGG